jgi:DNA-binding MarR family transcriptional regulator
MLAPTGLRATQYMVLVELANRGPISLGQLAKFMIMDTATIGKNVKPLEDIGYVSRSPGKDRRVKEVSLTPSGKLAYEEGKPYWMQAQEVFEAKVGADEALALRQALALVADIDFLSE